MAAQPKKDPPKSTARRDRLVEIEEEMQKRWEAEKLFESDAGEVTRAPDSKYFTTFPYPYMNGLLHLGHTFSLSKMEFALGYERLKGKRCLWPFAFHCTGMPIQAAANKLKEEIKKYGCPPVFPTEAAPEAPAAAEAAPTQPGGAHHGKKSKASAKKGAASQWGILIDLGIPPEEIPKFQDPVYWLGYFPPLAKEHLIKMGVKVDWRRTFITTSVNPYYDSFIKWQFNKLRALDKLDFGKRYSVYSPLDGQLCADHDRAVGEGVGAQEYTCVRLDLVPGRFPAPLVQFDGQRLSLVAATLRPETMYGQTNCWILPDGDYAVYKLKGDIGLVITAARAARNMSFQDLLPEWGQAPPLAHVKGTDLIGCALKAPLCPHEVVYCLPMMTISLTKGTGIVTSVPSDSPDDFMALSDLKKKAEFRAKFGVTDEMVAFEPIPIIETPGMGQNAAELVCKEMKIQSQNDRDKLALAKEKVYQKGFYEGKIIIGDFAGESVQSAKNKVRDLLLAQGHALKYAEPEKYVESRTGDECVVALTDQWYIKYGEEEWRQAVSDHLATVETYSPETRKLFETALGWLREWGCSRSFGLGTKLPWDEQYVIESLSDSTIYMAFYTVAHLLQGIDNFDGTRPGPIGIDAAALTDDVWEYIFQDAPFPASTAIPREKLEQCRQEFQYWYPVDLRVSGKDLIQNHLTFFLYNHTALFPQHQWPRAIRTNGHVLLGHEKMSKSTGNFLTLEKALELFGADAMRLTLAQAGDSNNDANFEPDDANAAVLRLSTELKWIEDMLKLRDAGSLRGGERSLFDRMFDAEMTRVVAECESGFARHNFRDAVNGAFFNFQLVRDAYRNQCGATTPQNCHVELVERFIETQLLLIAPICPHFADHCWTNLLHKPASIMHAAWPQCPPPEPLMLRISSYLGNTLHEFRKKKAEQKAKAGKGAKGKAAAAPEGPLNKATVVVATSFEPFQNAVLTFLAANMAEDGEYDKGRMMADPGVAPEKKKAMPFAKYVTDDYKVRGRDALELTLPFNEAEIIEQVTKYVCAELEVVALAIVRKEDAEAAGVGQRAASAVPGKPVVLYSTQE